MQSFIKVSTAALEWISVSIKRIDNDTVEVYRRGTYIKAFFWLLVVFGPLASGLFYSVIRLNPVYIIRPHVIVAHELIESAQWIWFPKSLVFDQYELSLGVREDRLRELEAEKHTYSDNPELYKQLKASYQPRTFEQFFEEGYSNRLPRAKKTIIIALIISTIPFWPRKRGVRFDRRRKLIYHWNRGRLFVAPASPGDDPLATLSAKIRPEGLKHEDPTYQRYPFKIFLFRHRKDMPPLKMPYYLGVIPPAAAYQNEGLYAALQEFMGNPKIDWDEDLDNERYNRYSFFNDPDNYGGAFLPKWMVIFANIFSWSYFGSWGYPEKRVQKALDKYQAWWNGLTGQEKQAYLQTISDVDKLRYSI